MGIGEIIGILFGVYAANFVSTYAIRCHIINKNVEDFRVMAKKLNFPDDLREYMEKTLDKKPEWYDYIPGVNLLLALKDWIMRKDEMELLEGDIKHFEEEYGSVEQFVNNSEEVELEYKEYFVGYFLESRPIVIYFKYDGDINIAISEDSAPTFRALDEQMQVDTLLRILYEIYIGSNEYIKCSDISEVFTDTMVQNLEQIFEMKNAEYIIEKEPTKDLVRRKPKV